MKKISIFIIIFLLSVNIFGQTEKLNALFDQYQEKDGVTSIKIAKPMFKMLGSLKIDNDELGKIQPLLSKVNGLKMLVLEKPRTSMNPNAQDQKILNQNNSIEKEINAALKNLKYEELMTVNSTDNKIKFLAQDTSSNVLDNLILNLTSEDSTVLMMLDGKISMDDVSKLMEETQSITSVNPATTINSTKNVGSERNVPAFTGIEVSSGVDLEFSQNPKQSVVVKVDPDKQQYVITEVENGILKVFIRNKGVKNLNINNLKVLVSAPELNKISTKSGASFKAAAPVSGTNLAVSSNSGSMISGDFKISTNTAVQAESGSNVKIGLTTKSLAISTSSGSSVRISGNADSGTYSASSGSSISASDFVVRSAVAEATSGSSVKINTTDSITASASSAASIQYKGNPSKVTKSAQEITGASISKTN